MKQKRNLIVHLFLLVGVFFVIGPFIWMVISSFKSQEEILRVPMVMFPSKLLIQNYLRALDAVPFLSLFINTFAVAAVKIFLAIIFSNMAGYAFAKIKFPAREFIFYFVLLQMMVPPQVNIIPQYMMVSKLHLNNTMFALIVPGLVSAYGTFLLRQFYKTMPNDLEEAAYLEGCNKGQILFKILMPLSKSTSVALGIFTLLFSWKDLMWPLIVNNSIDKMPLSSGLAIFFSNDSITLGEALAGGTISIIPIILVYLIFQRYFIEGIAGAGIKG